MRRKRHHPAETADRINERILEVVRKAGGRIDALYMCPHTPTTRANAATAPGMLRQAERDLGIDLAASYYVGDGAEDVWAAQAVGAGRYWCSPAGARRACSASNRPGRLRTKSWRTWRRLSQ